MKRFFLVFLSLLLLSGVSAADPVDLSGMSFDELVELRDQINLAIWNSQEWQEVTVPAGVWVIGEDIPAGHWSIEPMDGHMAYIVYCQELDESGFSYKYRTPHFDKTIVSKSHKQHDMYFNTIDLVMESNYYFINDSTVIFTPYAGKPDLGFK